MRSHIWCFTSNLFALVLSVNAASAIERSVKLCTHRDRGRENIIKKGRNCDVWKKLYDREHFQTQVEREALFFSYGCEYKRWESSNSPSTKKLHEQEEAKKKLPSKWFILLQFTRSCLAQRKHRVYVRQFTSWLFGHPTQEEEEEDERRWWMHNWNAVTAAPCDLTHFFFRQCMQIDDETVPCCISRHKLTHKSITGTFSIRTVHCELFCCVLLCFLSLSFMHLVRFASFLPFFLL